MALGQNPSGSSVSDEDNARARKLWLERQRKLKGVTDSPSGSTVSDEDNARARKLWLERQQKLQGGGSGQEVLDRFSKPHRPSPSGSGMPDFTGGETRFDLRRARVSSEADEATKRRTAAMERRFASQGFGRPSGQVGGAIREADVEARKATAQRLGMIDVEELKEGTQISEADKNRALTREIEAGRLSQDDKHLALQAYQFDSREDFDRWAVTQNIDSIKAGRIWQAIENAKGRTFQTSEREAGEAHDLNVIEVSNINAISRMNAADQIEARREGRLTTVNAWHAIGAANGAPPPEGADPMIIAAYNGGKAGKSIEDARMDAERQIQFETAAVLTRDPSDPDFLKNLQSMASGFGYSLNLAPGLTGDIEYEGTPLKLDFAGPGTQNTGEKTPEGYPIFSDAEGKTFVMVQKTGTAGEQITTRQYLQDGTDSVVHNGKTVERVRPIGKGYYQIIYSDGTKETSRTNPMA